jgi:ABC-type bacteriocin/lantibiotic exporter with double-glycine peptidase domain
MPLPPEQVRRLLLARALAGQPRLLLIYDALDSLDARISEAVLDWILRPDAPWTAVVATRNPAVISRCDRVWRVEHGSLRELSPLDLLGHLEGPRRNEPRT